MLKTLRSLFGGAPASDASPVARVTTAFADVDMVWYADTRMPLPVWEEIAKAERPGWTPAEHDAFWTAAAGRWLQAIAAGLSPSYRIHESEDFLLLSELEDRPAEVFMQFCQSVRRRIVRNLRDIAVPRSGGKHVVMVFASEDEYYDYIAHYYPDDGGEYAMSAGMFIHGGYGHFVMFEGEMEHMQPVIAHELTHCLLSHLPIPAWLNEGLAVNTEQAIFPHLADPRRSLYYPHEIKAKHAAFWNAGTIQEFWSGKSFLRSDDGNMLSYDLAKRITAVAARGEEAFRAFVLDADGRDAGMSAEHWLGYPLEHLIIPVLGEGDWRPAPAGWQEGVERGQF
ncbi:MAG: hypothetical protein HOP03_05010 [Lysobacter sp.]|nr:hypothetical protein [Lysobacter sp.]